MSYAYVLPEEETLPLSRPVSLADGMEEYSDITLKEPDLDQTEKFYRERDKNGVLSGIALLISLVSGVPVPAVKKLKFRDYKRCEVWLTRFLTWTPEETQEKQEGSSGPT